MPSAGPEMQVQLAPSSPITVWPSAACLSHLFGFHSCCFAGLLQLVQLCDAFQVATHEASLLLDY